MAKHDFSEIWALYPRVIEEMKPSFTSHEFISRFSQLNHNEYDQALHAYRDGHMHMHVHSQLSRMLNKVDNIKSDGRAKSCDVFENSNTCSKWRKLV
jgi:uncharacterized protein YutD